MAPSWRVFVTDASRQYFERLTEAEREALAEALFSWVETGLRRANRRPVAGGALGRRSEALDKNHAASTKAAYARDFAHFAE